MEKQEIVEKFQKGYDCSQVVLSAFSEELGMSVVDAHKISACFGGGMGKGEVCGAVVGALMVIGMKYGYFDETKKEQKQDMIEKRTAFLEAFEKMYGSCICKKILGYDISKEEELSVILEKNLLFDLCPQIVHDTIQLLQEISKKHE